MIGIPQDQDDQFTINLFRQTTISSTGRGTSASNSMIGGFTDDIGNDFLTEMVVFGKTFIYKIEMYLQYSLSFPRTLFRNVHKYHN